jgi:hypothetical protein
MEKLKPTDPVAIDLGDGVTRHLRYSLGSMRRLKNKFGSTMLSESSLMGLDEDKLAELIHEGLVEKDGLSIDDMADLIDSRRLKEIIEGFSLAFSGSMPEKKAASQTATVQ